jgi:hypothetical protein
LLLRSSGDGAFAIVVSMGGTLGPHSCRVTGRDESNTSAISKSAVITVIVVDP